MIASGHDMKKPGNSGNKKRKKWILIAAAVLIVLILIVVAEMCGGVEVQVATARQGTIRAYVVERARTTLPRVYKMTMPFDGRVEAITLEGGTAVKKGEVVATLDRDKLVDSLEQFNETVKSFQDAVDASQAQVIASRAVKEYARWVAAAQKALYPDNLVSEMTVKNAEKDVVEAESALKESQAMYYSMIALNAATKLLPRQVTRDLKRATLTSPIDGVVLKRHFQNERVVGAGEPLLDIGDLGTMEVTADILSEEAVNIRPGDEVDIFGSAVGTKPIRGKVKKVRPEAFTKISSLGVEQQKVTVEITINPDDLAALREAGSTLGVEYRVRVRIYTAARRNAVIIPYSALFRGSGGKWRTFAVRDGRAELIDLEIGLSNESEAQVTAGLKAGEDVILAPPATLTSGARVKVEKQQ